MILNTLRKLTEMMFGVPPLPKPESFHTLVPPSDGRVFAWVRTRGATQTPVQPVVLHDQGVGPKLEIVGPMYVIRPHLYHLPISELATIYPAPDVAGTE